MKRFLLLILIFPLIVSASPSGVTSSVLSSGRWWKIAITETGIHQITRQDLVNLGIDPSVIDPSRIRLYGNGGQSLPESNALPRPSDLREIAIEVKGGEDGKFDEGDVIIFYATGIIWWTFNPATGYFSHTKNIYSARSFYFLTIGNENGKRINVVPSPATPPAYESVSFTGLAVHENDSLSLIKSGKGWVGEAFNQNKNTWSYSFSFPSVISTNPLRIVSSVVAKSSKKSSFIIGSNGSRIDTIFMDLTDPANSSVFAKHKVQVSDLMLPPDQFSYDISYDVPNSDAQGWLDYVEITGRRSLTFHEGQMSFRDPMTIGKGVTRYIMTGGVPGLRIWNITHEDMVQEAEIALSGDSLIFVSANDTLEEFIAFDGNVFLPVEIVGEVPNQNLHGLGTARMVIVTHPLFMTAAQRLAEFHRQENDLSVLVADVEQVYNEFSSGKKDISAIRDFVRMLYDRASTDDRPAYLLLFGDGSYDPMNRISGNNDFIPTFQSRESLKPITSYVTDDFFGLMAPNAGYESNGSLDIGIGRLPVSTPEEAELIVNKIIHYSDYSDTIYSDWRNGMTFIADDENNNLHLQQAEELVSIVNTKYPGINVNKIYLDAYKMVQTAAGNRLPLVNDAINSAIRNGTLILNYTGHGGEDGWSAEKVLTVPDITSWSNTDKMPVFVTATCEFSRFDNPGRHTAGEKVLMHPNGGAIALYSTTRLSLATTNFKLDTSFFSNLMPAGGGPQPTMGDLIRISKNRNGNSYAIRNFVLLGDPAQKIAFPEQQAVITRINGQPADPAIADTLLGLSSVTLKGEIRDREGNRLNNFNGELFARMYDKPVSNMTIGNTPDSYPQQFKTQNALLYSGRVAVQNGEFEFSFVIPAGVRLQLGKGKISLYARNGTTDAGGFSNNIITGGKDPDVTPDTEGPQMELFMDDLSFMNGGETAENTSLIVTLEDPQGINFINLGIGHEISALLDDSKTSVILNDHFIPDAGPYQKGTVTFPFSNLSEGRHVILVKSWDMFNNSSEKQIEFFVRSKHAPLVRELVIQPNPVHDHATFTFTPAEGSGQLEVKIDVYTMAGQLIKTLRKNFGEQDGKLSVEWDGRGDNGSSLCSGIYLYQLAAHRSDGSNLRIGGKLVKLD